MKRTIWMALTCFFLFCGTLNAEGTNQAAQPEAKSSLEQRAEAASETKNIALARSSYIRAYEDYASKGKLRQAVECGTKGAALYYKENYYKEAFDLLRRIDQSILTAETGNNANALHYLVTKERMQIYMKLRKPANAQEQLGLMEKQAAASGEEQLQNDLLYTKALFYYTSGQNEKGNSVFKQMVGRLTGTKEYAKVDEVYRTLIENGRRSGSANLVAQAYTGYIAWKDSVAELKRVDEVGALNQEIQERQATIEDKDSALRSRNRIIIGLGLILAALAAALVIGTLILLRYIVLTNRQKKTIRIANENNALKAQFISNIAAQLTPNLEKLGQKPEVQALKDFAEHIQTLSRLESTADQKVETEETALQPFCENLIDSIRGKIRNNATVVMEVPKTTLPINREYVSHILLHLLDNAAFFTPEEGHIKLEFKKRSAHKCQFLVSNTGSFIPEEQREDVFKPFIGVRDLTEGDGLGLAICRQMALKMNGDIIIDPEFTKGTRFILNLMV